MTAQNNDEVDDNNIDIVIIVARYNNKFHWYRTDRGLWILDVDKWRKEMISLGYELPEFNNGHNTYRFGMNIVNETNAQQFLDHMVQDEIHPDTLSIDLAHRYSYAESWDDIADLFPIAFVDFDHREVSGFYLDGIKIERYVPDGWTGEFIDFAFEAPESKFPTSAKFWVKGDEDLLKFILVRIWQKEQRNQKAK